jgi:hypothetical protein
VFPGESLGVAICNMITALAEGQTPEQKKIMWDRYITLTEPLQLIVEAAAKDAVELIKKIKEAS